MKASKKPETKKAGTGKMIATRKHPSELRRGSMSYEDVVKCAKTLEIINGQMRAAMKEMEQNNVRQLDTVDGYTKFDRGIELIAKFAANLGRSIAEERFGR